MDKHRRQDHGHHGQGAEAPPPLRAGRGADPHLHAHEEGRQVGRERQEVLPSLGPRMRGKGVCVVTAGSPPVSGSPDAGEGGVCGRGLAAVGCRSVSCVFHLQQGWPLPVLPSPLAREEQLLRLKPSQGFSLCS